MSGGQKGCWPPSWHTAPAPNSRTPRVLPAAPQPHYSCAFLFPLSPRPPFCLSRKQPRQPLPAGDSLPGSVALAPYQDPAWTQRSSVHPHPSEWGLGLLRGERSPHRERGMFGTVGSVGQAGYVGQVADSPLPPPWVSGMFGNRHSLNPSFCTAGENCDPKTCSP